MKDRLTRPLVQKRLHGAAQVSGVKQISRDPPDAVVGQLHPTLTEVADHLLGGSVGQGGAVAVAALVVVALAPFADRRGIER